jgi:Pentapeptide repeats (8 copies)
MAKPPSSTAKNRKPAIAADPAHDPAAEPPVAFDAEGLKRVRDIIKNARATWFALLGALVFASITLASVKDVSFFVNSVETKLPLVGISVPVTSFFWAGSLLIAAIYAYFHLYLELLWQALGDAPARIDGKPLADRIDPWIVADSALRLRDRLRGAHGEERASRKRAMQLVSDVVSVGLVWVFGLAVIGWFWWRSMPKHDPVLTGFIGIVFASTFWVFCKGLTGVIAHLDEQDSQPPVLKRRFLKGSQRWKPVFALAIVLVAAATLSRTGKDNPDEIWRDAFVLGNICSVPKPVGGAIQSPPSGEMEKPKLPFYCWRNDDLMKFILHPAPANLREVVFTEKPKEWQSKEIAETEFRVRWCKERGEPKCANPLENQKFDGNEEGSFQRTWNNRRAAALAQLPRADLRGADLRGADLRAAEIEGTWLFNATLDGANLTDAKLEGAYLFYATLNGANLTRTDLERTTLSGASLRDADLSFARIVGAVVFLARLNGANLEGARVFGLPWKSTRPRGYEPKRSLFSQYGIQVRGHESRACGGTQWV